MDVYEDVNWAPLRRERRIFGLSAGTALGIIAGIVFWRTGAFLLLPALFAGASALLVITGICAPRILLWPYRIWMAVLAPVAFIFQCFLLTIFFFAVLSPLAVVLRLMGRDKLRVKSDSEVVSYWKTCERIEDVRRYFRQY